MKRIIMLGCFVVLLSGCTHDEEVHQQGVRERERSRQAIIQQQTEALKACQEHGGVPITKMSDMYSWSDGEYTLQLVRCELPCTITSVLEKSR